MFPTSTRRHLIFDPVTAICGASGGETPYRGHVATRMSPHELESMDGRLRRPPIRGIAPGRHAQNRESRS